MNKFRSFVALAMLALTCQLSFSALASELLETRIQEVLDPASPQDVYRVLATADGQIYRLASAQKELAAELRAAAESHQAIKLVANGHELISFSTLSAEESGNYHDEFDAVGFDDATQTLVAPNVTAAYEPTVFGSEQEVSSLFQSLERQFKRKSQCYQRAHTWAYAMWSGRGVRSMKVFLFFTRRYIREYNYDWWFHVSPFTYVVGQNGAQEERVLDRTFIQQPLAMKDWTDEFMYSKADCPTISTYREYADNQELTHCYLRKVPMYYYQPMNIESADARGETILQFDMGQVAHAQSARGRGWW